MSAADWPIEEWHGHEGAEPSGFGSCGCQGYTCRACGGEVRTYNANGIIYEERQPESTYADYWVLCMSVGCPNHHGAGMDTQEAIEDVADWAQRVSS